MLRRSLTLLVAAVTFAACSEDSNPTELSEPTVSQLAEQASRAASRSEGENTIVDIAVGLATAEENPEFTILVAALQAADLVEALDGRGQRTVFAPTDAAFAYLLDEVLGITAEELLGNTELLTQVLLYHVAPGRRLSGDVLEADQIRTLQGGFLFPEVTDEGAFILDTSAATADAQLQAPDLIDIEASNGVIHVIDEVLLFGEDDPREDDDDEDEEEYDDDDDDEDEEEYEDDDADDEADDDDDDVTIAGLVASLATAEENPEFTVLLAALQAADLVDALDGDREFTVFAPTDAAFGILLDALDVTAEELLGNTELLTQVLLYHVVRGDRDSEDVLESRRLRTLEGSFLRPRVRRDGAFIVDLNDLTEDAQLLGPDLIDIEVENGIIHVIDQVLLPELG